MVELTTLFLSLPFFPSLPLLYYCFVLISPMKYFLPSSPYAVNHFSSLKFTSLIFDAGNMPYPLFFLLTAGKLFYNAELASAVQRRESAVCVPLLVGSAPHPGPRRVLSGAPCAAREVLVSFLRDAEQRVCVSARSPSSFHPSFSLLSSMFVPYVCVSTLLCKWVPLHHFSRVHIPVLVYDIFFFFFWSLR